MTDKLPEWLDSWIASARYPDGDMVPCIAVHDLRTFLSKFVLCEWEPVATTLCADPYDEDCSDEGPWLSRHDWRKITALPAGVTLHAPAEGVPDA